MPLYNSMIAWVALTAVVYAAFFSGPAPEKGKVNWFFAVLTFGYIIFWASLVVQLVKNPPAMWETWV